jgi:hypothetical protein
MYLRQLFTASSHSDINYLWDLVVLAYTDLLLMQVLQGLRFSPVWHCVYEATTREVPPETSLCL